ncbi:MAG: choice-of-anchor L domain-containing protein [Flavobacteriales bacterium]|nr:choice-of-anchor L domain-containing protein [Flavobacteriales bacterium]MBP9079135.1 choice-of-anchor L domain-containing protein [Flavobacteriales bacterium]
MSLRYVLIVPLFLLSCLVQAQMTVGTSMTPAQLVQNVLLGNGITVSNITYNGVPSPATPQAGSGSFAANPASFAISDGIILSSALAGSIPGSEPGINSDFLGTGSDPDLLDIIGDLNPSGPQSNDKAVLEFDFIPTGDSVKFNYIFASEEYPGYNCSPQFNDVFGFFISGPGITGPYTNNARNIALVPGTTQPVSISSIHGADGFGCPPSNAQYYVSNTGGTTVIFGGYTTVLTALEAVTCGETYHIKLAICDAGDSVFDSGVFLQAGSFTSTGQVVPSLTTGTASLGMNDSTMFEGCGVIPFNFFRQGDTTNTDTIHLLIGGTATAGVDYFPPFPSQIIYQPGDTLITFPLNLPYDADGLETVTINISQNIVCSGTQVVNDYTFYIDQYQPLQLVTTDVNGLCGESYVIGPQVSSGAGVYGYLWSTGDTTPTITVSVDTTTTFYVTVTDTCSVPAALDSITVTIPIYPPLVVTAVGDTAIPCLGNADISVLNTTGGNGDYTYTWSQGGASAGAGTTINVPASDTLWYVVTAFDGCMHTATDSVQVTTVPLPDIAIMSWDSLVFCIGDSMVLFPQGVSGGNGVYTYSWTNGAGTVLSTADTLLVGVPGDSTYILHVQDQCGYSADSTFTTYIPHYPPFLIQLTPDSTICAGDSIALWARISGGSGQYTIDWQGWSWSDPKFTYAGDQSADFTVNVMDRCGEFISATSRVTVQHPTAKILIYNKGQDDWLFQTSTFPYSVPVKIWDLGDGTIVKADSVTHSYTDLDDHWVTLHTVSAEGCKAMDSLLVIPPGTLFFPNAFTPDGDGINDTFGPVYSSVGTYYLAIFDRWGHLVFETKDINQHWDGTVKGGGAATTGVYVFKYQAKGHYYEANEKYGHVTLVRGTNGR